MKMKMSLNQELSIQSKTGKFRYVIVAMMFMCYLVAYFDRSNVTILLADMNFLNHFDIAADKAAQGLLMTGFMVSYGIFNFVAGPVTKYFGPRKVLLFAVFSWSLLMLIMGSVNVFAVLVACRILLGLGESVMTPACSTIVQNWFPQKERVKANGIWFIGTLFAPAATVPIVIWALTSYGWSGSFFALSAIGLVPLIAMLFLLKNYPQESSFVGKAEIEHIGTQVLQKEKATAKDYTFLKDYIFWCNLAVDCTLLTFFWGLMSWIPSYLKTVLDFSWAGMGVLASLPSVAGAIAIILVSPIMDRLNLRALFILGAAIISGIFMFIAIISSERLTIGIFLALAMACVTITVPAMYTILQNRIAPRMMPVAAGFFNGIAYIYAGLAPFVIGFLVNLTGSFVSGFCFLFVNIIVAIICAIPLVKQRL